jgi:hypothetical protein
MAKKRMPKTTLECAVCGKRSFVFLMAFGKKACSDACYCALFDLEYDLPAGTTLNQMLYQRARGRQKALAGA